MKKPWLEGIEVIDVNTPVSVWGGWFETFVLTAIVIAASFITQQHDPFRLNGGFPWPLLAPLLAGLRYGFVYGFVSALLILAILGVAINQQWQIATGFPLPWAIGIVVVAMGNRRCCRGDGGGRISRYVGTPVTPAGRRLPISRGTPGGIYAQLSTVTLVARPPGANCR